MKSLPERLLLSFPVVKGIFYACKFQDKEAMRIESHQYSFPGGIQQIYQNCNCLIILSLDIFYTK